MVDDPRRADIYLIQNKTNGKCYVGQTISGYKTRWTQHCNKARKDGRKHVLHQAIAKYGKDAFTVLKLLDIELSSADEYEQMYVDLYDCMVPSGYNMIQVCIPLEERIASWELLFPMTRCAMQAGRGTAMATEASVRMMYTKLYPDKQLPMNISYRKVDNNEGYVVKRQGYGNSKAFMSMKYSMDEKLQMAKDHLATLTERRPKTQRVYPKHICARTDRRTGRKFLLIEIKRKKKVVFWKAFNGGSSEEQLLRAQECLQILRSQGTIE